MRLFSSATRRLSTPSAARCLLLVVAASFSLPAFAAVPLLQRDQVIALVKERSPQARVGRARIGEARALRVGATAAAPTNPELGFLVGPRFAGPSAIPDYSLTLSWPFDLSGAPAARGEVASERIAAAESDVASLEQSVVSQALELWVRAVGAAERVALEGQRVKLDEELVRVARVRKEAGASGSGDLALAQALAGQASARQIRAEGDRDALLALLRGRLGLPAGEELVIPESLPETRPLALEVLLDAAGRRPELVKVMADRKASEADARLQHKVGTPVPRLELTGGRSSEYFVQGGAVLPLPIYQRNQTATAVAEARVETSGAEVGRVRSEVDAQVRSAFATWSAAHRASALLDATMPVVVEAEHLATRAYELGQSPLSELLAVRRETADATAARHEAHLLLSLAEIALELSAGVLP